MTIGLAQPKFGINETNYFYKSISAADDEWSQESEAAVVSQFF